MIHSFVLRLLSIAAGLSLLFATTALPVLAASTPATSSTRSKTTTQHGPTPGDSQIEATIRAKLAKSKIGKDGLRFKVSHGVVTWEGKTDVMQHKGSATRMARTAGASQVVNNIQISDAAKAKAAANLKKGAPSDGPKKAAVS